MPPTTSAENAPLQPMLANLLANLHGMAYRCRNDQSWTMEFVSQGCLELTEYAAEDLLGNRRISYEEIIHPDDRGRVRTEVEAALKTGNRFELCYRIVTATGKERWVIEHGLAIVPPAGGDCFLEGIITDITARKRAEEALRESEEKFAKAFGASPDAISISDAETGRFLEVNEGYEQLSGYTRVELIGRTSHELGIWSNPADRGRMIAELKEKGSVRNLEVVARMRDGRLCTFMMSAESVMISGRACLVLHSRDVTDQKAAEQALRESEERFAKAFRASPDAISIVEVETGRILEVNDAVERIFGFNRAELIGRTSLELNHWADLADRDRMVQMLQRDGRVKDFKVRGRKRDGRVFMCLFSAERIELKGRACIVTVVQDITPQFEAEQALRESEQKFAKAFDSSSYAQIISDQATGQYLNVNDAFVVLAGYTRDEAVGRTALQLGLWKHPEERAEMIRRLLADGQVRHYEVTFLSRTGREIAALCSCESIEVGGRPCILSIVEDITERRRTEEARAALEAQLRQAQKLEALGQLAGGIAHDFNNILTGVLAFTELAVIDLDRPGEARKHLSEVSKAGHRARQLVRQILAFSRQQVQERAPVRLNSVVREAAELLRSSLPSTIAITVQTEAKAPVVLADQIQVHQIIMNLGTNAAHAMRDRSGTLTIRLEPTLLGEAECAAVRGLRPGLHARLSVSDNGHGMDAATLKRIFEPFFTTKGPGDGTGLGLAVVHGIVEDHEGAIQVQSQPGEGTTFTIYLPQHATLAQPATTEPVALPRGRGEHVLFLDDERMITDSVRALFGHIGYRVSAHTDPQAALTTFMAQPASFDLVVTDLTMPHITGIEVARQILAARPNIPVLLASGYSGTWTPENLRALGIRGLIPKPLSSAGLATAVRQALDEPAGMVRS